MAKQCIYCGHLLAKEDALFCNDCGQSQDAPASASAAAGGSAPSAIKVKLPPKEFSRTDSFAARPENSSPGRGTPVAPSPREQAVPPSSRLPKRPTRLAPSEPSASADKEKEEAAGDMLSAMARLAGSAQASAPTPAEEISTMVLPNWREELAQLRKEQGQASKASSVTPEKKVERPAMEPPPLPHRSSSTPLPLRESDEARPPALQPRPQPARSSDLASGARAPQASTRPAEPPRRTSNAPMPQERTRPTEPPQRAQLTPPPSVPLTPPENISSAEVSRRELRVKVWGQEATVQASQVHEEKQEPGPAPAIEQNPFATVAFGVDEQVLEVDERETLQWQTPLSPIPASPSRPPIREEKPSPRKEESRSSIKGEGQAARGETRPPVEARPPLKEEKSKPVVKQEDDIEDLPTMPLAVPPQAQAGAQLKIERASTPAPKKWSTSPADEVEDLPTRPMAASTASSVAPAAPRTPQPPVLPPTQSGERRPEPAQAEPPFPFGQRPVNPSSLPGGYGAPPSAQPAAQAMETAVDPLASRGRPVNPHSQSGAAFDLASLPPLPPGPVVAPGSVPQRSSTPFPDSVSQRPPQTPPEPFAQRPPQRPPSFESPPLDKSASPILSKPAAEVKKPRKKRHTGRMLVIVLVLLVLLGGGVGVVFNREWVSQYFQAAGSTQPFQTYKDDKLGISLDYTLHWNINLDPVHSIVKFIDTSKTGQATLTVTAANGQVSDYLNQQVAQLGITGSKPASPVTFAGSSWQVVQGTVVQSGATYTIALYVTQHNNRFYLLEFQAPQTSFAPEEASSFAHMRSSFQFI